ncbi:Hypothetical predicted protein [Podarcis lilfordi]|uniref:Uncharacterized protein n=1 Tax=Podarcis lilfordi TaxID=74358 RepID=A0AA35KH22_9SAUR|nr:Hypothetical predicted protein [Podarcis lilfordi]
MTNRFVTAEVFRGLDSHCLQKQTSNLNAPMAQFFWVSLNCHAASDTESPGLS